MANLIPQSGFYKKPEGGSISPTPDQVAKLQEQEAQARAKLQQAIADCEARGGTWDGTKCVFGPKTMKYDPKLFTNIKTDAPVTPVVPLQDPTKMANLEQFSQDRNTLAAQLGNQYKADLAIKSGKMPPTTLQEAAQGTLSKITGDQASQQAALQANRLQQLQQLAQQGLLSQDELSAIQGASPNYGQAIGAGITSAVPGVVAGIVGGATIGALGGPIGAVGGAIIGGTAAFLNGMRSSIKSQQVGAFSADQSALSKGQTMLRSLITDTNQNPQNAPENIELFYKTLNMIDAAHVRTWKDSQEDLNKFLGNDGTEQLAKFDIFDSTMRQYYINRLNAAIASPDPNQMMLTAEDLANE